MKGPLHLYVDGSCLGNQNVDHLTPAGWGIVVVEGDNGLGTGKGEIIFEDSGLVETDRDAENYFGAEVGSNNTAELTAFIYALRWVLIQSDDRPVVIRADSQYAGNIASSKWKAKKNKELAKYVQSLWNEVSAQKEISWNHVHAHRGHRWNERADHLAARATNGEKPLSLGFWKPGMR